MHMIQKIIAGRKTDKRAGIYSCCSANETVLRACMEHAASLGACALVEATANQVDQSGGYTGMTPEKFHAFASELAAQSGLPAERLILGGDHLGPLTFAGLPEEEAMGRACELVGLYALAGFTKLHLDTSMKLASDGAGPLAVELVAERAARLCAVCEGAYKERRALYPGAPAPVYVIGSEVPIPGGAQEHEDSVAVTKKSAALETLEAFRLAFARAGQAEAWERVIALVVQPGVEFGDDEVHIYDHDAAAELISVLYGRENMVFEAHSTDYQPRSALARMALDGFSVMKVGPALTFALREGLFALESIETELAPILCFPERSGFRKTLEKEMLADPSGWQKHYRGDGAGTAFKRAFSLSDRARYYLPRPAVGRAADLLLKNLAGAQIPISLISQYMPMQYAAVREGRLAASPLDLLKDRVADCARDYTSALSQGRQAL